MRGGRKRFLTLIRQPHPLITSFTLIVVVVGLFFDRQSQFNVKKKIYRLRGKLNFIPLLKR